MQEACCCAGHGHHGMLYPFDSSSILTFITSLMNIRFHSDGPDGTSGSTPFPEKPFVLALSPELWLVAMPCEQALSSRSFLAQAGNPVVMIYGACHLGCPPRTGSAGITCAADLAAWMPALQLHMEASGVVPQLTVSLGPLSPLGSLLACSSSFSFSCGATGSRTPSCGAPRISNSPDEACSSSGCSTRHSGTRPHEACQDNQLQQVCAVGVVSFAIHVPMLSLGLRFSGCRLSSLHPSRATRALQIRRSNK